MTTPSSASRSAFTSLGLAQTIERLKDELRMLYRADNDPWVIGYSGGKDSTAVTQLVWLALMELPAGERSKPVYIVTTDTMVENPVVAAWVEHSLRQMEIEANRRGLPIRPNLLRPAVENTFWVNLIGRGYPAPRHKFRWCTERLKIKPTSVFIEAQVSTHGEVILFLGARRAESTKRAASLNRAKDRERDFGLTRHPDLTGCLVYTPIADWSNDDVWQFLLSVQNPWGYDNKELMAMYRGATDDNECPVVVDTSTPSCGSSRFGCWVCTLVDQDKSMAAMIRNDVEKEWMLPLLEFRNNLDFRGEDKRRLDRERRDFRRITGRLSFYRDINGEIQLVPGPYTQDARADWLRRLLETQQALRSHPDAPEIMRDIELITGDELREIRRLWLEEKHEMEDLLPQIYEKTVGEAYPVDDDRHLFGQQELSLLREQCGDDRLQYELARNLLDVEWRHRLKGRRIGIFDSLRRQVESCFFRDEADALQFKRAEIQARGLIAEDDHDAATDSNVVAMTIKGKARSRDVGATPTPPADLFTEHASANGGDGGPS